MKCCGGLRTHLGTDLNTRIKSKSEIRSMNTVLHKAVNMLKKNENWQVLL